MTLSRSQPSAASLSEWSLLVLLIISVFINYMDRGNLSVAAPLLEKELSLSPLQIGLLLSGFFWTYALFQLFGIAGWLADRFPVSLVLAAGFFIWSAATFTTGFVSQFSALFVARLVLGAGESLAYPCYSRILAANLQNRRGLANALLDAGSKLGPSLGTLLGGLLLAQHGWRFLFVLMGGVSLLWLVPWLRWTPRAVSVSATPPQHYPSVLQLFWLRSAWGAFLGHFCGNYFWFFLLTWLPSYLVKERHFSITQMANIGAAVYLAMATATVTAGWLSDRWIRSGASPTLIRKSVVVTGLTLSTVIIPVAFVDNVHVSVLLLFLACISFGIYTSNHWAITQTLAGPLMAGRWTSLQNGLGNLSGIVAAWLTGAIVQQTGSFQLAFLIAAAIVLTGAFMWGIVVGPVKTVRWNVSL